MAKQAQESGTGTRLYVVLRRESAVTLTQLGVVPARDADRAIAKFTDYDPKTLIGIPTNRWNERKDCMLENEPKLNLGEAVPMVEADLSIEVAA